MLAGRNANAIESIIKLFKKSGYTVNYHLLNTSDYGVPQTRKRVIFVGYRKDLNISFIPPTPTTLFQAQKKTLKDAIYDLRNSAVKSIEKNHANVNTIIDN